MCIIAAKNRGVEFPSTDIIENMWYSNSDGAGLMWVERSKVHISKGFMTLAAFKTKISQLSNRLDLTSTPMVMHFRIGTHGGNTPENTHPFPITESISALKKLEFKTNIGVAHNGIIPISTRSKDISDTMEYIAAQLAPIKSIKPTFFNDKNCQKLIYNGIQSKMCFLNFDGKIYTIGDFTKEKSGMIYSNASYLPRTYYPTWDYGVYGSSLYGWDDDDYEYRNGYVPSLPKKSEEVKTDANPPKFSTYTSLMWIEEDKMYVTDDEGNFLDGDGFLIDRSMNVYEYESETNSIYKMDGFNVYSYSIDKLEFDYSKAEYMEYIP